MLARKRKHTDVYSSDAIICSKLRVTFSMTILNITSGIPSTRHRSAVATLGGNLFLLMTTQPVVFFIHFTHMTRTEHSYQTLSNTIFY